jgi:hypothetical protein
MLQPPKQPREREPAEGGGAGRGKGGWGDAEVCGGGGAILVEPAIILFQEMGAILLYHCPMKS